MKIIIAILATLFIGKLAPVSQINNQQPTQLAIVENQQVTEPTVVNPIPNETTTLETPPATVAETVQEISTCQSEIAKYDWDQSTALAVMYAESSGDPTNLNDNPSTGDYSVGCFQINLYGRNALNRPSEQELYDPSINVAFAHRLYVSNGNSFIGQWGVCRSKVACY